MGGVVDQILFNNAAGNNLDDSYDYDYETNVNHFNPVQAMMLGNKQNPYSMPFSPVMGQAGDMSMMDPQQGNSFRIQPNQMISNFIPQGQMVGNYMGRMTPGLNGYPIIPEPGLNGYPIIPDQAQMSKVFFKEVGLNMGGLQILPGNGIYAQNQSINDSFNQFGENVNQGVLGENQILGPVANNKDV